MVDFATLAAVNIEDLPEQVKMPMGNYIWSIDRLPEEALSKAGNSTNVTFRLKCVEALTDVDPDDLVKFGSPTGTVRTLNFNIPNEAREGEEEGNFKNRQAGAVKRLHTFLAHHVKAEGDSLREMMSNCLNYHVVAGIKHKPHYLDKELLVEEFDRTAPVEA